MLQAIPSIQIGYGFAVELFIIVFSFLCWLVAPANAVSASSDSKTVTLISENNEVSDSQKEEALSVQPTEQVSSAFRDLTVGQVKQDYYVGIIEDLNAVQAKKVASLLKEWGIIDSSKKLRGKGISRDWFIFLLQDHLPAHPVEVKQALEQVLKRDLP
jgi:hypothetical protein